MKISSDKEYTTRDGEKVRVICTDRFAPYPVVALIGTISFIETYTSEGTCSASGRHPNDLVEVREWDDFKVGEPVMVREHKGSQWVRAYFARVNADGKPITWYDGHTSRSSEGNEEMWDECRRPTKEELE